MNRKSVKKARTLVTLSLLAAAQAPGAAMAQAISCPQNMMFGTLMACSAAAATVTVAPDASSSSSPGCLSVGGTQLQGRCVVTGTFFPVQVMQISVTSPTYTIVSGANDMQVNDFNLQTAAGGLTTTISAFLTSVNIGATLNIDAGQASGAYAGSVTVSVAYQ